MITDIEKQFFETFGIKPRSYLLCTSCWDCIDAQPCEQCHYGKLIEDEYPKITDRILLELICILSGWRQYCISYYVIDAVNINTLKSDILRDCICMLHWYEFNESSKDIKQKVQTLFKEEK